MSTDPKLPQAAEGKPDGTIPTGIPIEVFQQKLDVPTPQAGEEIRAALEAHEGDAVIRDPKTKGWVYIRTRVFVDLKALAAANMKEVKDGTDVHHEPEAHNNPDGPKAE